MPNRAPRLVTPAPANTVCRFNYYGRGCQGAHPGPSMAVHVLTADMPAGKAGTPLCGYHSPYDVLRRYELTLTPDDVKGAPVHTFTWGVTRMDAYTRVVEMMDDENGMWDGWSFSLANDPTPGIAG